MTVFLALWLAACAGLDSGPAPDLDRYDWPSFAPTSIELGPDTRAMDFDGEPGDDGLRVRISPKDNAGHTVKWPGLIEIVLGTSVLSGTQPVHTWVFDPKSAEDHWTESALSGYLFNELRWPEGKTPEINKGTLTVRFTTKSGAVLVRDKTVEISRH